MFILTGDGGRGDGFILRGRILFTSGGFLLLMEMTWERMEGREEGNDGGEGGNV